MVNLNSKTLMRVILAGLIAQMPLVPNSHAQDPNSEELDRLFEDEELEEPPGLYNSTPPPPPPPPEFSNGPAGFPDDSGSDMEPPRSFPTVQGGGGSSGSSGGGIKKPQVRAKSTKSGDKSKDLAAANIEDITNENFPDLIESFDYPNAEIQDVIKAISQLTGKNFIIDPSVRGKISIVAPSQITVAEAYKAFLSALAINGFTVVPSGKFLKVKSARNAQRDSIETYSGKYYPDSDVMITRIVHLKHTSADEINKRLRILPSKDGEMTPYEPTNSLIISDYGSNIERIMKIIKEIDQPGFEEQLAVVPIRYARAKDVADLVNQIINKEPSRGGAGGAGANPAFGAGVPRFRTRGAGTGTPEELSLVAPDDRTNSIIVVGNRAGIQKVRDLVKRLDYKLDPAEAGGVFVYYVRYGEAEKIAQTLSGIAQTSVAGGGGAPAAGGLGGGRPGAASPLNSQAIFGGDVRITADKNTNSLVITASKPDYETVLSILTKLDIPKDQVFVEAIIMEMNSSRNNSWNPTIYALDKESKGVGRVGFSSPGSLVNIFNPANDSGVILGFGTGDEVELNIAGQTFKVPSLLAFLNIIQSNTESNILSTPRILALDNEQAVIEVGDRIPVAQQAVTSATGQVAQGIQFEDATIKLEITPFIRPDSDVVRMKIKQIVKQPSNATVRAQALQQTATVLSNRSIDTNIVVSDGDTAVLGGLVRDEENVVESKVPILGDIPILGWLFKSRRSDTQKVNLVVFLTPKIIRNTEDRQNLVRKQSSERIDWLKRNFDGRDPYGKKIDSLPRSSKAPEGIPGN